MENHLILLGEFFAVCQENHRRLKLENFEFMQETMQYLGFDVGYGWWTPAASKAKPLMDAKVLHLHQRHSDGLDQEEYYLALGPTRATSV